MAEGDAMLSQPGRVAVRNLAEHNTRLLKQMTGILQHDFEVHPSSPSRLVEAS